ncbi:hypothetical protein [Paenibacillus marinisediminis]
MISLKKGIFRRTLTLGVSDFIVTDLIGDLLDFDLVYGHPNFTTPKKKPQHSNETPFFESCRSKKNENSLKFDVINSKEDISVPF